MVFNRRDNFHQKLTELLWSISNFLLHLCYGCGVSIYFIYMHLYWCRVHGGKMMVFLKLLWKMLYLSEYSLSDPYTWMLLFAAYKFGLLWWFLSSQSSILSLYCVIVQQFTGYFVDVLFVWIKWVEKYWNIKYEISIESIELNVCLVEMFGGWSSNSVFLLVYNIILKIVYLLSMDLYFVLYACIRKLL